jgi:hypothetical protein
MSLEALKKKDTYIRPKKTFQDQLTQEEIDKKLEGYAEVKDITSVPLNAHIRYYSLINKNGKESKIFRLGGFLKNKSKGDTFVILTNGKRSWSVQTKSSIFFRKINLDEIKILHNEEIEDLEYEIDNLHRVVKKLKKDNKKLLKIIDMGINEHLEETAINFKKENKKLRAIIKKMKIKNE